jgi:hypothetical protein
MYFFKIMKNYKAKIANFSLSREINFESREIKSIKKILPWLAPEKITKKNPYTDKCEIFR